MPDTQLNKQQPVGELVAREIHITLFHCIDDPEGNDDDLAQELTSKIMKRVNPVLSQAIQSAEAKARKDGAQLMWDSVIISGVAIDGVDYIKLEDIEERARDVIKSITPKETSK